MFELAQRRCLRLTISNEIETLKKSVITVITSFSKYYGSIIGFKFESRFQIYITTKYVNMSHAQNNKAQILSGGEAVKFTIIIYGNL